MRSKQHFVPRACVHVFYHCCTRYGFLLRVKAMGMGTAIDRERKIANYWARLMDEASAYDDGDEVDN